MAADHTLDPWEGSLLGGAHRMKLAVFGFNNSHGLAMTSAQGTVKADWREQVRIAQAAEQAGFDAVIPVSRWKGFGGEIDFNHRALDTMAWAAGLAAMTERVQVFSTTTVPTIHPVRAAKTIATIDHISGGRVGLNIVAGWNESEISMFGAAQFDHDKRYEVADEWIELVERLWTETAPFDFEGEFYQAPGAYSAPRPIQTRPVIMSAGISPRGRRFAVRHADLMFANVPADPEQLPEMVKQVKEEAASFGRRLQVFATTYIVCRDTDREAEAYWDYYVNEKGDWEGVKNFLELVAGEGGSLSRLPDEWRAMAAEIIAGYSSHRIVGSPETVTQRIQELADAGVDGITTAWVDYDEGLESFASKVYPLLAQAGLRSAS